MKNLLLPLLFLSMITSLKAQETDYHNDKEIITKVIKSFSNGIDTQNAAKIEETFTDNIGLFATSPDGETIITMPGNQFALAHGNKRFGGRARTIRIEHLDVTDGLTASAKVIAFDQKVYYTYYLTFFKKDGSWLIQTMLQRSKPLN